MFQMDFEALCSDQTRVSWILVSWTFGFFMSDRIFLKPAHGTK